MKYTKYWYISLIVLFSCQNNEIKNDDKPKEIRIIENEKLENIKKDSLSIITEDKYIDTSAIIDSTVTLKIDTDKKNNKPIKKTKPVLEEDFEPVPDEEDKFPKEKYFRFIKSQKFYDDSVAYYNWFMRSDYWRKKYGYPDSTEYYKHYLRHWSGRIRSIKSGYDWSE